MGSPHRTQKTTLSRGKPKRVSKPVIRVVQIHNPVYVKIDALNFPSLVQKLTGKKTHLPFSSSNSAGSLTQEAYPPQTCDFAGYDVVDRRMRSSRDDDFAVSPCDEDFVRMRALVECYGAGCHCSRSSCNGFEIAAPQEVDMRMTCACRDGASRDNEELDEMRAFVAGESRSRPAAPAGYGAGGQYCARRSCSSFRIGSSFYEESSPNHSDDLGSEEVEYGAGDAFSLDMQSFSELDIWAGLTSDQALPDITMLPPLLF